MQTNIQDIAGLVQKLRSMKGDAKGAVAMGVTMGAVKVRNRAVDKVPKVTRTLSRSIHPDNLEVTEAKVSIEIGTDVEYARRIELGFVGPDRLGRRYHQAPQPYLRPALAESEKSVVQDIQTAVRALLIKNSKGG